MGGYPMRSNEEERKEESTCNVRRDGDKVVRRERDVQ